MTPTFRRLKKASWHATDLHAGMERTEKELYLSYDKVYRQGVGIKIPSASEIHVTDIL